MFHINPDTIEAMHSVKFLPLINIHNNSKHSIAGAQSVKVRKKTIIIKDIFVDNSNLLLQLYIL